jgi:acyl-CoA dehydrogenase family protein 10
MAALLRHARTRASLPALGRLRSARAFSTAIADEPADDSMGPPTTGVRKGHELDVSKVLPLLAEAGAIPSATAACEVSQFSHGQSNPTYLLDVGGQRLVLRKQPPGKLLRGAHAVDREYTAMSALQSTAVPVPATRLFVHDTDVLGTPFLVCDYVSGRFFKDPSMRAAPSAEERARLYGGFMRAVAALHTVDYDACGLGAYGKVGGYTARQTKVWTSQFRAAETEPMAAMEKVYTACCSDPNAGLRPPLL